MTREYTRRHVLAGLGTAGAGLGTSIALFTGRSRAYTSYTMVPADVGTQASTASQSQSDGHGLRVAWWESYNGHVLETQGDGSETDAGRVLDDGSDPTFVQDATGPLINVGNVLPGDEGMVGIGIEADIPPGQEAAVWFRTRLVSESENGINEPESKHPDENPSDPDDGEMDELTQVTVWKNSGLTEFLGANDGRIAPVIEPVFGDGSLREVFAESDLADGIELDCLPGGETTYVALRWELPADVGNVVQSDSVTFDLEFRAAPCDGSDPFDGNGNGNNGNGNGNDNGNGRGNANGNGGGNS